MQSVSIHPPTDSELIRQFAAGSQSAFEQLVDRHATWVFAAAYRQLRDRHLAEDATQAVFLLLARKASAMSANHKLSGWLFNTTQYTVKSIRRAERRREKYERQNAKPQAANAPMEDLSEYLDAAVAKLSAGDRTIVILRFYQGLEFAQIAEMMNLTEPTARRRLNRAIVRLRPNVSWEEISAAAVMGQEMMGGSLPEQLMRNAAGQGSSASAGTIAKGATRLMNAMKIKMAAAVCAAAAVAGVSTYAVIGQVATRLAQASVAVALPQTPLEQFRQAYAVDNLHALVHIKPPLPAARDTVYRQQYPGSTSPVPGSLLVHWSDKGTPEFWASGGAAMGTRFLVQGVLGFFPQEMEGDVDVLSVQLPGDFALRSDVTAPPSPAMERMLCRDIQNILVRDAGVPVVLTLRTVPRKVMVLSGQWKYSPVDADAATRQEVEFYSRTWNSRVVNMMGDAPAAMWAKFLGSYIKRQVVIEATGMPENIHFKASATPVDMGTVLEHVREQTGLKWSEETRNVQRLFVEAQ